MAIKAAHGNENGNDKDHEEEIKNDNIKPNPDSDSDKECGETKDGTVFFEDIGQDDFFEA